MRSKKSRQPHFRLTRDAEDWAQGESLKFDTDEECQEEAERLLEECYVEERDDPNFER